MTYKILKTDPVLDTHDFFVDTVEDLTDLPIEPASAALIATTGDIYICTNSGQWVNFNNKDDDSEEELEESEE